MFFPIFIVALLAVPYWILKRKIPLRLMADKECDVFEIVYNKRNSKQQNLHLTAFSYDKKGLYSMLTIFYKIKSKRGHWVYKKSASILGLEASYSWTSKDLFNIALDLKNIGVEEILHKDDGGFIDKMID